MVVVWDQAKDAARSRKKRVETERFLMVAPEAKFFVAVCSREKWRMGEAWNPALESWIAFCCLGLAVIVVLLVIGLP